MPTADWLYSALVSRTNAKPSSSNTSQDSWRRSRKASPSGLTTIDEALARSEHNDERWSLAELLRIKGELVLAEGSPTAGIPAADYFQR